MSRYIEMAHRLASEEMPARTADVAASTLIRKLVSSVSARKTLVSKPVRYNDAAKRVVNIVGLIARHERDLAQARKAPIDGGGSRSFQLQISRRLHQARGDLAELQSQA
jgi:hypothetical protein